MSRDGHTDYRRLSMSQLREALANIDADRYPRNFVRLQAEIAARERGDAPEPGGVADPSGRIELFTAFRVVLAIMLAVYAAACIARQKLPYVVLGRVTRGGGDVVVLYGPAVWLGALAALAAAAALVVEPPRSAKSPGAWRALRGSLLLIAAALWCAALVLGRR